MKKKGFTLIELLAVIVILAIIALIIVPVVANIIESARFGAAKDSVLEYVHSANQYGALSLAGVSDEGLTINGTLESGVNDSELEKIKYSGTKFDYIYMLFDESNNVINGSFCINGYSIDYLYGDVTKSVGYCNEQAGLYDENSKLIKTWDELVSLGCNISERKDAGSKSCGEVINDVLGTKKGKLVIPSSVTAIGENQFSGASNLIGIKLPKSLVSIKSGAFNRTSLSIVNIPDSVTELGANVFGESSVKFIKVGEGVTVIPNSFAFSTKSLEKVILGSNVVEIEREAFNVSNLKDINFPSSLKKIGREAFGTTNLEEVNLPDNMELVDTNAFRGMPNLTKVSFGKIDTVGQKVFAENVSLSDITIREGVQIIGNGMFMGAYGTPNAKIVNVTLPSTITTIDVNAFQYTGLETINIPSNVTKIGSMTFGQTNLKSVKFDDNSSWSGVRVGTGASATFTPTTESENANYLMGDGRFYTWTK
ncbi:MAG: leucine-rich repeat domain-containing protein [Bacilli bacterium]|nr:leucine-rich repeat domain-containing protein [Bacilli bacterium]